MSACSSCLMHSSNSCHLCCSSPRMEHSFDRATHATNLQVIVALSVRGRDHIPYRSSKLTHVLKDSLGGNCKTLMVACIWTEAAQLEETTSTCRWLPQINASSC